MRPAVRIDVRARIRDVTRDLDDLARKQIPFATATGLNDVAQQVFEAETKALETVFEDPQSFTRRAFGIKRARKNDLEAKVFAKPIQAEYLAPSEFDEPQALGGGRKIRTPVEIGTGAGGNIPKNKMRNMLARPDVFVGHVKGIGGVWQRLPTKGKRASKTGQKLKLLVAFTRPVKIAPRLEYHERAAAIVDKAWGPAFEAAMTRAMKSRR